MSNVIKGAAPMSAAQIKNAKGFLIDSIEMLKSKIEQGKAEGWNLDTLNSHLTSAQLLLKILN